VKLRPTVSANPLSPVTVIVEFPGEPTSIDAGDTDPADIEKSTMFNVM
jgi:hypothetical protein